MVENSRGYRALHPSVPSAPPPALLSLPFLLLSSPGGPDGSHRTHALALLQVKRPSDALWFPWQRALEPRGISICRARAGERSKRHRSGLQHLFKTIPLFPIRRGRDDAPLFQNWDLEMKLSDKIQKDKRSRGCASFSDPFVRHSDCLSSEAHQGIELSLKPSEGPSDNR